MKKFSPPRSMKVLSLLEARLFWLLSSSCPEVSSEPVVYTNKPEAVGSVILK